MNKQQKTYTFILEGITSYILGNNLDYNQDKLNRLANKLAIKNTWRISHLPQGREQFDALYELFKEIK